MHEMTVDATIENIPSVTDFVNKKLEVLNCPLKAMTQIDIAIDELFGNISNYAYTPEIGPATVRVEVEKDPVAVIITFIDGGRQFDPASRDNPDLSVPAAERRIGGLGLYLVRKTMDEITYEYRNGKNILRIRKSF